MDQKEFTDTHNNQIPVLNSKTLARIAVVQASYYFEVNKSSINHSSILKEVCLIYSSKQGMSDIMEVTEDFDYTLNYKLCKKIFNFLIENYDLISETVSSYVKSIEDMQLILSSILRAGTAEIISYPETSHKIIVSEYTNIATEMCSCVQDVNFINSVLDKIAKNLRAK